MPFSRYDSAARLVRNYNDAGAEVSTRPYTAAEIAADTARIAAEAARANEATIAAALDASLVSLQAIIDDTNANINTNPAQRIKDLARVQRRLIRLVIRRFDGTA